MAKDREKPRYGFIGLGSQGAPMAQRMIDAGLPVVLWARRAETLVPYRSTSAVFAASAAELGSLVEHVGVCVYDDADVLEVCGQLTLGMEAGATIAIHSTVHPDTCRTVEARAAARGIHVLDAPVSGGAPAAAAGALTIMVGGALDVLAAARPAFETFGGLIVHLGEVGAGQKAKLINNALLAAHIGLADVALAGGVALGIERKGLVELLRASSGRSMGLEIRARMANLSNFGHGGKVLAKDFELFGRVLGETDPNFLALRKAAQPLLEAAEKW